MARVGIDYHLPGSLEDSLRSETLPVRDVERPVHIAEAAVAFHFERCRFVVHRLDCNAAF
jgi:hypothetical protein